MKRLHRFLGGILCSVMVLSLTAVAASGSRGSGKSTLTLSGDRRINGTATTTETKVPASDIRRISAYGKVTVSMDWDNIYFDFSKEAKKAASVTASGSKDGKDKYSYVSWGTHVVMYEGDDDSSYSTSAAGPVDVFYDNSGRSEAVTEPKKEDTTLQRVYESTGVDLGDLAFVPFEYLWLKNEEELDPQYEPLKTFLIDEFILAAEGEGLPSGVYYDDNNAYIVRSLGDGKLRFVHGKIGEENIQAAKEAAAADTGDGERVFDGQTYFLAEVYDIE